MPRYRGWKNFNPRTPCGVRPQRGLVLVKVPPFQSTHPLRGATRLPPLWPRQATFQSTHPLRGATRGGAGDILHGGISIHAPLAGCDSSQAAKGRAPANFNPRTPCGVRRHRRQGNQSARGFQSTHPLRGATERLGDYPAFPDISIHAPLAGCDHNRDTMQMYSRISIHAPLAGCDQEDEGEDEGEEFQSTHPLRGATSPFVLGMFALVFQSTHPLRGATL